MDFLHSLDGDLRSLSAEARKKHPVVKEACDRAVLKLLERLREFSFESLYELASVGARG